MKRESDREAEARSNLEMEPGKRQEDNGKLYYRDAKARRRCPVVRSGPPRGDLPGVGAQMEKPEKADLHESSRLRTKQKCPLRASVKNKGANVHDPARRRMKTKTVQEKHKNI